MSALITLLAFLVALGTLIVVHEAGHFLVARWAGVKVLRFSVGFGQSIYLRTFGADRSEFSIGVIPLGGYVRMLDEREGPVPEDERHRAFNNQSVGKRIAIVVAGPLANFLLAIAVYWALFANGVEEPRPVFGTPTQGSLVDQAGFKAGERITHLNGREITTLQELRWALLDQGLEHRPVQLQTLNADQQIDTHALSLKSLGQKALEGDVLKEAGFTPLQIDLPAEIGAVQMGSAAERAGLRAGDRVVAIQDKTINNWTDLVGAIRKSAGQSLVFTLDRGAQAAQKITVQVEEFDDKGEKIGRIGIAAPHSTELREKLMVKISYSVPQALWQGLVQTWDTSVFSLKMMGRMVTGEVSWKNLSGPVTIADYAGQSARMGLEPYIRFIALISISLGVLNLLPIPLLDGGHLMYYFAEIIKGSPVSEQTMLLGQRIGMAILAVMMACAFYNDISRLVSG